MPQPPHDPKPQIDRDELREHVELLDQATRDDLDGLLTDLLCHVYRTRGAQDC